MTPTPPDSAPPKRLIITIDGPAGTGKSTVAHRLAQRLGLDFLDTGAMYRAAALIALEQDIDPADGDALAAAVRAADLHFDFGADPPVLMLHDRVISEAVRRMPVSSIVSIVAAQPMVRDVLVEQQRTVAERHPRLVSEGRDQGSVVFPDAAVKFFLYADVLVRASRRVDQLARAGQQVRADEIAEDIRRRDALDASREIAPLVRPDDAVDIDTSDRSIDEVVGAMEQVVRERLPGAGFPL